MLKAHVEGKHLEGHSDRLKARFGEGRCKTPAVERSLHHYSPHLDLTRRSASPCAFSGPLGLVEEPVAITALSGLLQLEVQMLGLSPGIIALSTLLPLPLILSNFLLNF